MRSASPTDSMPRAAEIRAAAAMPMLTASPWGKPCRLLDRVPQGVAEIELSPFARLEGVGLDERRL